MNLDSDTTAVVVDMQNGFCHPDDSLYAPPSKVMIPRVHHRTRRLAVRRDGRTLRERGLAAQLYLIG